LVGDMWGYPPAAPALSTGQRWPGILLASMPSAPVGARLAHTLRLPVLKRVFAILVLLAAAKLLSG